MPVHALSKIPTWLNDWRPDVYTKLTDQEEWTYTNKSAQLSQWEDEFTRLATALDTWKSLARESKVEDLIPAAYQYLLIAGQFNINSGSEGMCHAYEMMDGNGVFDTILGEAVDVYNETLSTASNPDYTSATITAKVTALGAAATQETNHVNSILALAASGGKKVVHKAMFQPLPPGTPMSKGTLAQLIYVTYKWKHAYQVFGFTLELPPGV